MKKEMSKTCTENLYGPEPMTPLMTFYSFQIEWEHFVFNARRPDTSINCYYHSQKKQKWMLYKHGEPTC